MVEGRPVVIAIDGPAGAGKSTVARALAQRLGFAYLDTGAMYRAFALKALNSGIDLDDGIGLSVLLASTVLDADANGVLLDGGNVSDAIRTAQISEASSQVASHPGVRALMVQQQRAAASKAFRGAVMEGRDIATVVLPEAELKLFITAGRQERARRRAKQAGTDISDELEAIRQRDRRDTERSASPLKAAQDAVVIDTTSLSIDEVVEKVVSLLSEKSPT